MRKVSLTTLYWEQFIAHLDLLKDKHNETTMLCSSCWTFISQEEID